MSLQKAETLLNKDVYPKHNNSPKAADSDNYRAIAERYFQKKILPDEIVHHIDGNQSNNNPENLVIMKNSRHSKLHSSGLLGALSKWRKQKAKPLCNSCLFVRLYEDMPQPWDFDFSMDIADTMLNWGKTNRKTFKQNDLWKELVKTIYENCKRWKLENKHDCYEERNLQIVRERPFQYDGFTGS